MKAITVRIKDSETVIHGLGTADPAHHAVTIKCDLSGDHRIIPWSNISQVEVHHSCCAAEPGFDEERLDIMVRKFFPVKWEDGESFRAFDSQTFNQLSSKWIDRHNYRVRESLRKE